MTKFRPKGLRARPIAVALLAFASTGAVAEDQKAATDNNGLMVFPNVTVINAPASAAAPAAPAAGAAGMRVQKDTNSGKLRAPTAEEVQALDAATPPEPEAEIVVTKLPRGGTMARLNDSYMSYSVVHKDSDGQLHDGCVTGEAAAEQAVQQSVADEEVRHDR